MYHTAAPLDVVAGGFPSSPARPAAAADAVGAAISVLRAAERPLIVAGGGAFWSGAGEEIAAFAQQAQIPVITASAARGVVADSHTWCLGSLLHGGLAIPASDCVLVLGSAFNANLMYGSAPLFGAEQTLLQVDIAAERLGGNRTVDIPLVGDVRTVMHDLRTAWGEATPRDAW